MIEIFEDEDEDEPLFVPEGNLSWTAFHYKNFDRHFIHSHMYILTKVIKVKHFYMIL